VEQNNKKFWEELISYLPLTVILVIWYNKYNSGAYSVANTGTRTPALPRLDNQGEQEFKSR
jgi:hypothetical protein